MVAERRKNVAKGSEGRSQKRYLCGIFNVLLFASLNMFRVNQVLDSNRVPKSEVPSVPVKQTTMRISHRDMEELTVKEPLEIRNSSCRILIRNIKVDYHYEILESVALRYPLPWGKLAYSCEDSGLSVDDPIMVDYEIGLSKFPESRWSAREGWHWKRYFEEHLRGQIRNRTFSDGRFIQFRSLVGMTVEDLNTLRWNDYAVTISASADTYLVKTLRSMKTDKYLYIVLHGINIVIPKRFKDRTCYLNPQHHPKCWFIPADYPNFPPPMPPFVKGNNLRVCIPGNKRMTQVILALDTLKPKNVSIVLFGRNIQSLSQFGNLSHFVETVDGVKDYWAFQQKIAQCHVMLPLIQPSGDAKRYFLLTNVSAMDTGKAGYLGKLSGFVSQLIGNRIPSLLHHSVAEIYRTELTARYYEYDDDNDSFVTAFQNMMESFASH